MEGGTLGHFPKRWRRSDFRSPRKSDACRSPHEPAARRRRA
jgi:hypothetical protein